MSAWRRNAIAALPEHRALVERADSPMSLKIELGDGFDSAVATGDTDRIRRLLGYAAWCVSEGSGKLPNETSTAVVTAFYEHLPTRRAYWPMFREWIDPPRFHTLLPHLGYFLSEPELAELVSRYAGTRKRGRS